MLSRRSVLKTGAASAATLALMTPSLAADPTPSETLNKLFDTFIDENLDLSPTFATSLGVDTGKRAHQKREIDDASLAGIAEERGAGREPTGAAFRLRPRLGQR